MFEESLGDAERVIHLRPDWPKGYFRKGAALYGLGQYEDAAVAFLQCLALDQKVTPARDNLSKVGLYISFLLYKCSKTRVSYLFMLFIIS